MKHGNPIIVWAIPAFLGLMAGCAAILPTVADLETREGVSFSSEKRTSLSRGRAIVLARCSRCHRQFGPEEYETARWREILPKHLQRASLRREQLRNIEAYFVTASSPGK
ncbi:MAG: hypothetical protein ACYTFG_03215 [Planctomycetota bacterium]|jgi:mono/diheme cytochrome c family protein